MTKLPVALCAALFSTLVLSFNAQAESNSEVIELQDRWAEVNYQLSGDQQVEAFAALAEQADQVTERYPDSAEAWIWSGIIKSTYAGAKGGLGALSLAKDSRRDLEKAMDIDPDAMNGSAYTSLGTLYYSVPGWPVGFGNNDKAEELLSKALTLAPQDIDANYFYAEFLRDQKEYDKARTYYLKAQSAPARPGRTLADQGRQEDIRKALEALN
jgi:tetratricopeptide (TPR) repeat protein